MKELTQQFIALFSGRADIHGGEDGLCVKTAPNWKAHLSGRRPIGIYPLMPDSRVWWAAVDADSDDYDAARRVQDALGAMGLPAYIERSRSRGWHVWLFFSEPVPAFRARAAMRHAACRAGLPPKTEIFPKQDTADAVKYGNYVRLPYPGNAEPGRRCIYLGGEPATLEQFLGEVERIAPSDLEAALEAAGLPLEPEAPKERTPFVPMEATDEARRYAMAAMTKELDALAAVPPGEGQNNALNRCAFSCGQFVAAGLLDEETVVAEIRNVAMALPTNGKGPWTLKDVDKTLFSGLTSGKREPRGIPENNVVRGGKKKRAANFSKTVNGAAEAWAAGVEGRFLHTSNNQWWEYGDGLWRMVDDPYIERDVRDFCLPKWGDALTPKVLTNVVRMARLLLLRNVREMGGQPSLIPFKNGVLDIETNEFLDHSPEHLLTRQLAYPYDPKADCPKFRRFLRQVLITADGATCEEWVRVMEEWFGYLLLPDSSAQTAMLWLGNGANGKGVLTKVMEAFVGRDNSIAVAVDQLKDPYHRADLFGKMLGTTGDLDKNDMKHAAGWFKAIVGGDTISARHPGGRVFHFVPTMRLMISCNDLPDTSDVSYGYFRRLLIMQFRLDVADKDKIHDLPDQLIAEMPGIFNLALEGLRRFEANGRHFTRSEESERVRDEYRAQQDPVAGFLAECCERGEDFWEWNDALYARYREYCMGEDRKPRGPQSFGMALKAYKIAEAVSGRNKETGKVAKYRAGIRLKRDA